MKALLLSTTDIRGGACRGAFKLFTALDKRQDVEPRMLVQEKYGEHPLVDPLCVPLRGRRKQFDLHGLWRDYPDRVRTPFSVHRVPGGVAWAVRRQRPDLAHLHWVSAGFVRIEALARFRVPLVWTFRDMWPMTGGCHYAGDCLGYLEQCGFCPILRSGAESDLSRRIFKRKQRAWKELGIHVVAPCAWMADCARQSALFRDADITVIPNGVDVARFAPVEQVAARRELGLPERGRLLLFGAEYALQDARKGFAHLREALKRLRHRLGPEGLSLLVFGADLPSDHDLPFPARSLGRVDDDRLLGLAYSAADVFCAPSVQENMANTVLESLACGTPVVAFRIGGMPDMITPEENGWLAEPFDPDDLAQGIMWSTQAGIPAREAARRSALERFDINLVAAQYAAVYARIMDKQSKQS